MELETKFCLLHMGNNFTSLWIYVSTKIFGLQLLTPAFPRAFVQASSIRIACLGLNEKEILDKVHKHVCGHSYYYEINTLLQRNIIRNDDSEIFLSGVFDTCVACYATQLSTGRRAVSLNHFSRLFIQLVFIDFFIFEQLQLFHCMDAVSRYSLAVVVDSLTLLEAISAFEQSWITHFWVLESLQGDDAFNRTEFLSYMKSIG